MAALSLSMNSDCGAEVDATAIPGAGDLPDAVLLYSESPSRIVAEVEPANAAAFEAALAGIPVALLFRLTVREPARSLPAPSQQTPIGEVLRTLASRPALVALAVPLTWTWTWRD